MFHLVIKLPKIKMLLSGSCVFISCLSTHTSFSLKIAFQDIKPWLLLPWFTVPMLTVYQSPSSKWIPAKMIFWNWNPIMIWFCTVNVSLQNDTPLLCCSPHILLCDICNLSTAASDDDHFFIRGDCGVLGGEEFHFLQMDELFVSWLTDAYILLCLLWLHFAELYPSNWHAPSLHYTVTHWCMHPLHFAFLLSFVFRSYGFLLFGFCCEYPSPLLHIVLPQPPFLSLVLSYHSSTPLLVLFHLSISSVFSPPPHNAAGLPASLFLPILHILSASLFLTPSFNTCFLPLLLCSRTPPTTCLCSTLSVGTCWTLCEVSIGSCYTCTDWMMMVMLVLLGCCVWPGKAQMPFSYKVLTRCMHRLLCVCMCKMHRSQAGRETTGPWVSSLTF